MPNTDMKAQHCLHIVHIDRPLAQRSWDFQHRRAGQLATGTRLHTRYESACLSAYKIRMNFAQVLFLDLRHRVPLRSDCGSLLEKDPRHHASMRSGTM